MRSRRNYAPVLGLLLSFAAILAYFTVFNRVVAPRIPFLRDYPVVNLGLVALALWLSFVGIRRAFTRRSPYRGKVLAPTLGLLNLALAGLFCWYLFDYSYRLPAAASAPVVGTAAPDFTLPDQSGNPVHLASLRGHNVLLVFYRGHW